MAENSPGHLPIYDASGKIVGYQQGAPTAAANPSTEASQPDLGFEAYLSHILTQAGGMQISGSDHKTGAVFGSGPYRGKSKSQVMEEARRAWSQMQPDQRQPFMDMGNNRDIRGPGVAGTPLSVPGTTGASNDVASHAPATALPVSFPSGLSGPNGSALGKPLVAGPSPYAAERYNAMGAQQAQRAQTARNDVQALGDHYAANPEAYVDRSIEGRDQELAKSGITDMGGKQAVLNNQYGSGYATQMKPGEQRPPAKFFDEHGQVDLAASGKAGQTMYDTAGGATVPWKGDAALDVVRAPNHTQVAGQIQQKQNEIAGAGLPITDPRTSESRRAADRTTAIANIATNPAYKGVVQQSDNNANTVGAAVTNKALSQPNAAERQVQNAASSLPVALPQPMATPAAPQPPKVMDNTPLIRPAFA